MQCVVPDRGLTVAVTSDPDRPARSDGHVGALNGLLAEAIIPPPAERLRDRSGLDGRGRRADSATALPPRG
jgi:hypothetical protein